MHSGRSSVKRTHQRGYTVMDILMTVGLIGIVGGLVATPVQEAFSRYRVNAAANIVASELRSARSLAMTHGSVVEVSFNAQAKTVEVIDLADQDNPTRVVKQLGSEIIFATLPAQTIRFFPRGFVRGGTIQLQDGHGYSLFVNMDASGRSTVSETNHATS